MRRSSCIAGCLALCPSTPQPKHFARYRHSSQLRFSTKKEMSGFLWPISTPSPRILKGITQETRRLLARPSRLSAPVFYRFSLHVLEQLSEIMSRLVLGLVPPTVITALHTGDITAFAKWDDDVHGATFRRVDLRAGRSQETTIHGSRRRTAVWDWAQRRY